MVNVPIVGSYMRCGIGGIYYGGEIWRINTWWRALEAVTPTDLPEMVGDVSANFGAGVWGAASDAWKSFVSSACDFSHEEGDLYTDGVKVAQYTNTFTAVPGTGTAGPALAALVCTLYTDGFGRSARGRVYLPYSGGWNTVGQANSVTSGMLNNLKSWLNKSSSAGVTGPATEPVVMSLTKGQASTVTHIRVDSKCDTQHPRQQKAALSANVQVVL